MFEHLQASPIYENGKKRHRDDGWDEEPVVCAIRPIAIQVQPHVRPFMAQLHWEGMCQLGLSLRLHRLVLDVRSMHHHVPTTHQGEQTCTENKGDAYNDQGDPAGYGSTDLSSQGAGSWNLRIHSKLRSANQAHCFDAETSPCNKLAHPQPSRYRIVCVPAKEVLLKCTRREWAISISASSGLLSPNVRLGHITATM